MKHEPKADAVNAKLQSKVAIQRNEIARLTQLVEKLMAQRDQLHKDLQWMRGETK